MYTIYIINYKIGDFSGRGERERKKRERERERAEREREREGERGRDRWREILQAYEDYKVREREFDVVCEIDTLPNS